MIRPLVPSVISSFSFLSLLLPLRIFVFSGTANLFFFKFQNQLFKLRLKFSNICIKNKPALLAPPPLQREPLSSPQPHLTHGNTALPKYLFWRCPSMMPFNEAFQRCPSKMPLKDPPQRCPSEMPLKDATRRCPSKMPLKDDPQRCASKIPLPFRIDALPRWP